MVLSLEERRTRFELIMTYEMLHGFTRVDSSRAAQEATRLTRLTAEPG